MTPEQTINHANYIEWLKLIQKCYLLAYICGFVILSHILTLSEADLSSTISIPLLTVPVPRVLAVVFTLFLFWGLGVTVIVSNRKLEEIGKILPPEVIEALKNFPSISNGSYALRVILYVGLLLTFFLIFYLGNNSTLDADVVINSLLSTGPFAIAIFVSASKKSKKKTVKAASD